MRSATRKGNVGGMAVTLSLALLAATGICRAEVGSAWIPGQPVARVTGYKLVAIGDDPEPVPTVWRVFSAQGSGHVVLNPDGEANGDGPPSLVTDPATGLLTAAWSRNSASGFDIVTSRFDNGEWTMPEVVAGSPGNELDPELVLDPDGSIHMFYWVDGATPQVFHTQAPAGLTTWSTPVLVSQPGEAACRPAGVVFGGVLRVAYEVHDFGYGNAPRQVVLGRYENNSFVREVVAITNNLGEVRPEVHNHAGRMWVDWVDAELTDGSGEVGWTRLNAQGHWESIQYDSFANPEQRDFIVRGGVKMKAIQ